MYTIHIIWAYTIRNIHCIYSCLMFWETATGQAKRCPWFLAALRWLHFICRSFKLQFTPCLAPSIYQLHSFNTMTFYTWLNSRSFWWVVIPQMSLKEMKLIFRNKLSKSMLAIFIHVSCRILINVNVSMFLWMDPQPASFKAVRCSPMKSSHPTNHCWPYWLTSIDQGYFSSTLSGCLCPRKRAPWLWVSTMMTMMTDMTTNSANSDAIQVMLIRWSLCTGLQW